MRYPFLLLLCLGFAGFVQAGPADDAFRALYEKEWAWRLREHPQLATSLGVHDYDERLERVDVATQSAHLKFLKQVMRDLDAIDAPALTTENQVNLAIYREQIANGIASIELRAYLMPLNSDSSFYADLAQMPRSHPFATLHDYETYLARLAAIPTYLDENTDLLREGIRRGMTVPRVVLDGRDGPIRAVIAPGAITDHPLYEPMKTLPSSIGADDAARLRREAERVIRDAVIPAYAKLLDFYNKKYVPGARKTIAAYDLPNGKAYYRQQIREYTTLDATPEEIHATGLAEVARIRAEMEQVMRDAKFQGDFASFLKFLRTDPQFYARTPRELLMHASFIAKRIDGTLPKFFSVLPRLPYGVSPVPEAIAPYYTTGRYSPPAEGGREAGFYWVNTYKLEARPLYALPALTLHEAVPGHHLQGALAAEQGEQPPFRRYSYISAFGEGWALYCEHLGVEMGIYETPYDQFGRLTYEMWRAGRLVVDTGMHAMGWSRERALALLRDNTALSEHEITTEIDRYISWPGQALSYKLGELKIRELRARAEKALGKDFDLRAFHDAVLSLGSVPLPVLERHIDAFIAARQSEPGLQ